MYKEAKMFKCTVTTQDGDIWVFHVPDIHSFCVQMYDYFSEKCDVFQVKVEVEK